MSRGPWSPWRGGRRSLSGCAPGRGSRCRSVRSGAGLKRCSSGVSFDVGLMTRALTYMMRHSFRYPYVMTRWLTEEEQRAWRGLLRMTAQLNARANRQLQEEYGISLADYEVLVALSEAPEDRLRVFEVADALA